MKRFFSKLISGLIDLLPVILLFLAFSCGFAWGYRQGRETSREKLLEIQNSLVARGFAEYQITTNGVEWKIIAGARHE